MRLRFRTVFAAAMAVATVAEAENAREMWNIFSDEGLVFSMAQIIPKTTRYCQRA